MVIINGVVIKEIVRTQYTKHNMETINAIATAISYTLLTLMLGGLVYVMFWQPKNRVK
jgi:cytochrome b subunit of formate dehydrogenase